MLILMSLVIVYSKPSIRANLISDEDYLSRQRTCFVNGFFITFVFLRHINAYLCTPNRMEKVAEVVLRVLPYGQLIVTPFLFFSGYGIMYSLLKGGDVYTEKLLKRRFPTLWINYSIAVVCFILVNLFVIEENHSIIEIAQAFLVWKSIGHSVWYIAITLLSYLLIAASYYLIGRRVDGKMIILTTLMMVCACSLICLWKEDCWADTALCIPCGMSFCLYRKRIESFFDALPIPTILIGLLSSFFGVLLYRSVSSFSHGIGLPIVANIGAVLYVLGVCLVQGCISWKRLSFIMVWLGGPALFCIYIFQRIPMNIGRYFGWNTSCRDLYVIFCFIATIALALLMTPLFKRLQKLIFGS